MDPWPLRNLVLRTPRLELRPDDDAGLFELVEVAKRGIHEPDRMPFGVPWTDRHPREWAQYYWMMRATLSPADWTVNFLTRVDGRVIGMQGAAGKDFAITREVHTGSWLGREFQGKGYGTEMRAAVVMFAFDHLGAELLTSGALSDNQASHNVSRKLGYRQDGTNRIAIRGNVGVNVRLALTRERFVRPEWSVEVDGLDGCRALLGLDPSAS
ncbi:GNAT family N-acetyltransferase [Kibdelosporangium phytohabitans]|uniref:GCN5 family acetyltransferase n=1 Tax=Kibdelosporangium phytohabitans TaxID=860235 RepID=A0A0N9HUE9_9PSEU|nr:GNAT family N-acetyltransferase [Kibdelosporangium phytohabitans]ALG05700.1 GCN5 family acetyltransferase [Kibdelosporangium phytohabitans]MBE1466314.1 RimJ/RimL family protein N-acetyltransferase [Kibdelosporangium phytohabitans]